MYIREKCHPIPTYFELRRYPVLLNKYMLDSKLLLRIDLELHSVILVQMKKGAVKIIDIDFQVTFVTFGFKKKTCRLFVVYQ